MSVHLIEALCRNDDECISDCRRQVCLHIAHVALRNDHPRHSCISRMVLVVSCASLGHSSKWELRNLPLCGGACGHVAPAFTPRHP